MLLSAANQGEYISEPLLGIMYIKGNRILKNMGKARFWIGKAYKAEDKKVSETAKTIWDKNELWKY